MVTPEDLKIVDVDAYQTGQLGRVCLRLSDPPDYIWRTLFTKLAMGCVSIDFAIDGERLILFGPTHVLTQELLNTLKECVAKANAAYPQRLVAASRLHYAKNYTSEDVQKLRATLDFT